MRTKSKQPAPPNPPADLEEVKRRFVRQNRELAKNNSSQSLRIRGLELEVSRLLADNLELRNRVLQLQNAADEARTQTVREAARKVRERLRVQVALLSGVLDEMDGEEEMVTAEPGEKRRVEGNWRERQPLSEIMRENQMPTIVEGKSYPRRTLGADEIQAIRLSDHSSNESPDLGPPPVAHFDYDDPVKNASPLSRGMPCSPKASGGAEEDDIPSSFSVNLETRRKRKDGSSKAEERRPSSAPSSFEMADDEPPFILRTGAKRKLADREAERPVEPPGKPDFSFTRKTASAKTVKDEMENIRPAVSGHKEAPTSQPKPRRKALSDKSVNMSPQKTREVTIGTANEKPDSPKPPRLATTTTTKDAAPTRKRSTSLIPTPTPTDESPDIVEIPAPSPCEASAPNVDQEQQSQPNTPAPDPDLFSPPSSQPSTRLIDGRGDTPPPTNFSTSSDDTSARPSRRARSAVNYAEPSLISKMRRPDTKLVDAVSGLPDPRRRTAEKKAGGGGATRVVTIKSEPSEESEEWKDLTSEGGRAGSPPNERRPALESVLPDHDVELPKTTPSSSATLAQLMAHSRRHRQSAAPTGPQPDDAEIYDFKDSSASPSDGCGRAVAAAEEDEKPSERSAARSHRRHSSAPKEIARTVIKEKTTRPTETTAGDGGGGGGKGGAVLPRSERAANRRRSMML